MRRRTVIAVEPGLGESIVIRLDRAPGHIPDARQPLELGCDPTTMSDWSVADAVKTHGETIRAALEAHPAIRQALAMAESAMAPDVSPIYFHLMVDDAERLCWETLYGRDDRFLSFDARWPIARMADLAVDRPQASRAFAPPLRFVAVLSALGIDAAPEWQALREAVLDARGQGLAVELLVFVGERSLREAITAEGLEAVTAESLPARSSALLEAIDAFAPHLLHFFCHGSTDHGIGRLELATHVDFLQQAPMSSVQLTVDELLGTRALLETTWLVTLNCCEGGRAVEELFSMTHRLVASGVPAALGMLEPIDAGDAHELCREFYPALLDILRTTLDVAPPLDTVTLEFVDALRLARVGLRERHRNDPRNSREWTLPVLYVRPEPLQVRPRPPDGGAHGVAGAPAPADIEALRAQAEMVAQFLRALPPQERTESTRENALALLEGVPEAMRPDLFGQFPSGSARE